MSSWMFDLLMVLIAVGVMGFIFFKLAFSTSEHNRREVAGRPKPRFERREAERAERRKQKAQPPQGAERRGGPRR